MIKQVLFIQILILKVMLKQCKQSIFNSHNFSTTII